MKKNNEIMIHILNGFIVVFAFLGLFNILKHSISITIALILLAIVFLFKMLDTTKTDKKQSRKYLFGIIFIIILLLLNIFIK